MGNTLRDLVTFRKIKYKKYEGGGEHSSKEVLSEHLLQNIPQIFTSTPIYVVEFF